MNTSGFLSEKSASNVQAVKTNKKYVSLEEYDSRRFWKKAGPIGLFAAGTAAIGFLYFVYK